MLWRIFICVSIFFTGSCGSLEAFGPLSILTLGIPAMLLGGIPKKGIQRTLGQIDQVAKLVIIFIWFVFIAAAIVGVIFLIKMAFKARRRRKVTKVVSLMHRVEAEAMALQHSAQFGDEYKTLVIDAKREAVKDLIGCVRDPFFLKKLGPATHQRMMHALTMIEQESLPLDGQLAFLAQWTKVVQFLQL